MKCKKKVLGIIGSIVILSSSILVPVIAKYRDSSSHKEIAYANSFYFSSDYLTSVNSDQSGGAEYIIQGWDGIIPIDFTFQIRNYENPMLYNNSSQKVEYEVEYSSTDGSLIDYSVEKVLDSGTSEVLNGTLSGGSAQTDTYKVSIKPKHGVSINNDVSVRVLAKTKEGSPYNKTIATRIILQKAVSSQFISDQGFKDPTESSCALEYQLHTTSGVMDIGHSSLTNAGREIHITWDNTLVSIDENNSLLNEVREADKDREEGDKKFYYSVDKKVGNLIIEVLPYTSVNILFYKDTMENSSWYNGSDYLWNTNSESIVKAVEVIE